MKSISLCRLLGIIFILSGVAKAFNVNSFAYEVRLYADAYFWEGLSFWATPIAVAVCAIEIFFGLLALHKDYCTLCSIVFLGLLSFFTWLTGINYFTPSLLGSIESCGCFGELIHFSPLASFIKSAVLLVGATLNLFFSCQKEESCNNQILSRDWKWISLTGPASLLLPLFSLFTLESIEHITYSIFYIAICLTTVFFLIAKGRFQWKIK